MIKMFDERRVEILKKAINSGENIGPEKVMISPTDHCNLSCRTCWRLEKKGEYEELSLDEIENILDDCKKLGVKVIDFTGGGEPFVREDIFEIMKMIKSMGFFATLTTNGTLLDEAKIEKIVESEEKGS